jgi:hypothetical protein
MFTMLTNQENGGFMLKTYGEFIFIRLNTARHPGGYLKVAGPS